MKITTRKIEVLVEKLIKKLKKRKLFLGVMESCSGGGLANAITNVPGASEIFKGGIVAYSTELKIKFGVPKKLIKKFSVYSSEVALEMARQIRKKLNVDIGVGITGTISRPDSKEPKSKIGEVFIAIVSRDKKLVRKILFPNKKRSTVKIMIITESLKMINQVI
jgi:PncC family amidohydrolase